MSSPLVSLWPSRLINLTLLTLVTRDPKCQFRQCSRSTRCQYSTRDLQNHIMRSLLSLIIQLSSTRWESSSPSTKAVCHQTQEHRTPSLCQLKINRRFLRNKFSSTTLARQQKTLSAIITRTPCHSGKSIISSRRGRQALLSKSRGVSQLLPWDSLLLSTKTHQAWNWQMQINHPARIAELMKIAWVQVVARLIREGRVSLVLTPWLVVPTISQATSFSNLQSLSLKRNPSSMRWSCSRTLLEVLSFSSHLRKIPTVRNFRAQTQDFSAKKLSRAHPTLRKMKIKHKTRFPPKGFHLEPKLCLLAKSRLTKTSLR